MSNANDDPMNVIERLLAATNAHDVERIADCFSDGYTLESPLHPARSFRGKEQVRRNWTQILGAVRDLDARMVASARNGDTAWTEWHMKGTRPDGTAHDMRGVFIFRVQNESIIDGRMFFEAVDAANVDMSEAIRRTLESGAAR